MNKVIKQFLESTPDWIEARRIQARVAWPEQTCFLCGVDYKKIEELYEALKEEYGQVKINIKH